MILPYKVNYTNHYMITWEMFDSKTIKSKIDEIKKITNDLDEPYKTESFKILFSIALKKEESFKSIPNDGSEDITLDVQNGDKRIDDPMKKLALQCKITMEQLKDVLDYENKQFTILKKIVGNKTSDKQLTASLCILTAWAKGMDTPWISTLKLGDAVREAGIDTKHLGENLTRTDFFVLKGVKSGAKYHITTQGWQKGLEILKSLAEGA